VITQQDGTIRCGREERTRLTATADRIITNRNLKFEVQKYSQFVYFHLIIKLHCVSHSLHIRKKMGSKHFFKQTPRAATLLGGLTNAYL
jgi:hypothetical protein